MILKNIEYDAIRLAGSQARVIIDFVFFEYENLFEFKVLI